MTPLVLGVTELTQLAAIGPCLFLVVYLLASAQDYKLAVIPGTYFFLLSCTFILPIMAVLPALNQTIVSTLNTINEHLLPSISFLLIAQLIYRTFPPKIYLLCLALPLIGSGPFIIASTYSNEFCFKQDFCVNTKEFLNLYSVISGSLIFLLITLILARVQKKRPHESTTRKHKYWMIIALIGYNMLILSNDILYLNQVIDTDKRLFFKTMYGICFVYLAMTSVFRVFNHNFRIVPLTAKLSHREAIIANKIRVILDNEKPYLLTNYNRGDMADQLGLTEQHLSKIINNSFEKSFTDIMNECRIKHAQGYLHSDRKELSITDIAFKSGFSSIATFNRVFKQTEGLTPREYRNMNKK
jgi:AraC-like DNA-binding protein